MKKLLAIIALTALSASLLLAQKITGTWQGSLQAGQQSLRTVVKVSMADDKLKAEFYSIDQKSPAIPAAFTLEGSTVKMTIAAVGGKYEGKLSADGNSITGSWTQGGPPMTLNLVRATPETAWTIPEPPPPPARMDPKANPAFEVATVKPSDPNRPGKVFTLRGLDIVTINTTLNDLITMAYNLHAKQITGAPAWLESEKFDLTGRPDTPGQPNVEQMKIMIQKLLADRFQLKFHREKKVLAAYGITVAKTGKKFEKSEQDPNGLPGLFFRGLGNLTVRNATIGEFANLMQGAVLDRPVVDQTGLNDRYDFNLKWTLEPGQMMGFGAPPSPPPAETPDAPPDLFTAVQQQLGLRFESTKAPVDVLVVDKVEKPSAN